jgi:hypothetical protein
MAENKTIDQMSADDWRGLGNFTFNLNREQVVARLEKAEAHRDELLAACEAGCALLEALRLDGIIPPLYALPSPVRHHYQGTEAHLRTAIAKAKGQ